MVLPSASAEVDVLTNVFRNFTHEVFKTQELYQPDNRNVYDELTGEPIQAIDEIQYTNSAIIEDCGLHYDRIRMDLSSREGR